MVSEGRIGVRSLLVVGSCFYLGALIITQLSTGSLEGTVHQRLKGRAQTLRVLRFEIDGAAVSEDASDEGNTIRTTYRQERRVLTRAADDNVTSVTLQKNTYDGKSQLQAATPLAERFMPPKYTLLLNQPYLCHQVDDDYDVSPRMRVQPHPIYLLIIVHSHPSHKRRRNAIRETWGGITRVYDSRQVVIVFILGIPQDYDELQMVQKEAKLYRDVVAWNFVDDYRNLTIKSVLGFYWAAVHCQNAIYMMKADDDVYFNVPYMLEVLKDYPQHGLILGSLNPRSPVKRYGQWSVDYNQFPMTVFPPYCSGCAYVTSGDMAAKFYELYRSDQSPPLIPVEDVFITGMLAERIGVVCKHHDQFPTWITVPSLRFVQKFLRGSLLGLHGVDWIRMHSIWQMIHQCKNCSLDLRLMNKWLSWLMEKDPMYR